MSGFRGQIGFGEEGTYGVYAAPTRFLEFTGDSLRLDRPRIWSNGIRAGRRTRHRFALGAQRVLGDVPMELAAQGGGLVWKHILGAIATTGSNPYTHTATPGDLTGDSLTVQVGKPDVGGTVRSHSYLGCKITNAELACAVNEYARLTLSFYGAHEDTGQALGVASYPSGLSPFVFTNGAVTLAGSAFEVREFTLGINNGLAVDRHFIRGTTPERPKEPLEAARRDPGGTLTADFESLTAYNRFVNGTEAALVLALNAGAAAQLTITMNVEFDGETPQIESADDLLTQSLPYKVLSGTSDAAAITAVLVNADSAP